MANKINFQKELDKLLEQNQREARVPSLFLHSCCAPCSSYVIEYLSDYFQITVFYYNPNIYPDEEYLHRVKEQQHLICQIPQKYPVSFLEGDFDKERFYDMAKGLEKIPEGGERCFQCYRLRLEKTAQLAKEHGFDYFCTTLSISPLKNAQKLNEIGEELADTYGIPWLPSDFKKKMVINVPSSSQLFMVCTGRITAAACSQKKNENARLHLNLFDFAFL